MRPKIYISTEAMATVNSIRDLDYYHRLCLSDEPETDLTTAPGYYLNSNALNLAELPSDAEVAVWLAPADATTYRRHVAMPANLRGVLFSGAPNLPVNCAVIIAYWSPLVPTVHHRGAVYYQNVMNSYCVQLVDCDITDSAAVVTDADHAVDFLVSDGLVVTVTGLAATVADLKPEQYVALTVPVDPSMLGVELEGYRTAEEYAPGSVQQVETLYLRIADILASPDVNYIAISAIRTELSDYGYTY